MLKYASLLMFLFFGMTANAQFVFQGTSPINDTIDLASANTYSKSLIFKNTGSAAATFSASLAGPDAAKFKISVNRCATTATAKNKTCQVTIEGVRGLTQRVDPYIIGFDSVVINLTVNNSAAPPPSPTPVPPVSQFDFTPDTLAPLEFAPGELSKIVNLIVTNNGEAAFETPTVTIDSAGSLGVTFAINRCNVSVAAKKTCSVQLRIANPPDSNIQSRAIRVSVGSVEKDMILISASQTNVCVTNQKKACTAAFALVANQTCAADNKSYGICTIESCANGYFLENNTCSPATYTAKYSDYAPPVPQNPEVCSGTVTSTRTVTECKRDHDGVVVANSFCPDSQSSLPTQSPEGNKTFLIAHGSEVRSCPLGESTQTFVSRTCDLNYQDNGSICVASAPSVVSQFIGGSNSCLLSSNNSVYCWGNGGGIFSTNINSTPQLVPMTGVLAGKTLKQLSPGVGSINFSCAIASDNFGYCWGENAYGSLGSGSGSSYYNAVEVSRSGVLSGKTLKKIVSGGKHVCAIASDDKAYCWGYNEQGQAGNDLTTNALTPVAVSTTGVLSGKTIKDIVAGDEFSCALASDDKAYCWGYNYQGNLGNGSSDFQISVPVAVSTTGVLSGKTIRSISGNFAHTCVTTTDNKAYCWGYNANGQLGNQLTSNSNIPVEVNLTGALAGKTIKSITAGYLHTCAIANDDKVYCWGYNADGQLGNNSTMNSIIPVAVDVTGSLFNKTIKNISAYQHTCVVASDDRRYCWGLNNRGQLGDGTTTSSNFPVPTNNVPN